MVNRVAVAGFSTQFSPLKMTERQENIEQLRKTEFLKPKAIYTTLGGGILSSIRNIFFIILGGGSVGVP